LDGSSPGKVNLTTHTAENKGRGEEFDFDCEKVEAKKHKHFEQELTVSL